MSKKLPWPVAKVREDGVPAVWITFTNWMVIREGLVRAYLQERERGGARRARVEARQPDVTDHIDFSQSNAEAALALYRVGWEAYNKVEERAGLNKLRSPESLAKLGDEAEMREYKVEAARLPRREAA